MIKSVNMITHNGKFRDLRMASELCSSVPGAVAEVGVYRGGSLAVLAKLFPGKSVYGVDTFDGMPAVVDDDIHEEGDFSDTDYEQVRDALCGAFLNVIVLKGFFPDDVVGVLPQEFAMVHVDCDIYTSVRDCCEFFWPRMVSGGVLVFDDPGFQTCPGARRAFSEFGFDGGEILSMGEGASWIVQKGN